VTPNGDGGTLNGTGGTPDSDGGTLNGTGGAPDSDGGVFPLRTVFQCPDDLGDIQGGPVNVSRQLIVGDTLTLDLEYGGGCEEHAFEVCFEPSFEESDPVGGTLVVIHYQPAPDLCMAVLRETISVDLAPYADVYRERYQNDGGTISTNYGLYAFGELSCTERRFAASGQSRMALDYALAAEGRECDTADDCQWLGFGTQCSVGCGAMVPVNRQAELERTLASIDALICGDYSECPELAPPLCVPPPEYACVAGLCEEASP
jgi:hypothetical protein